MRRDVLMCLLVLAGIFEVPADQQSLRRRVAEGAPITRRLVQLPGDLTQFTPPPKSSQQSTLRLRARYWRCLWENRMVSCLERYPNRWMAALPGISIGP